MTTKISISPVKSESPCAVRGLALVFVLTVLSLVGVMLTITMLGGLGEWTRWQFVGMFGMVECGAGLANIYSPNIWRLPVAEVQTRERTKVRLAPSIVFIPHWAAAARAGAGVLMIAVAAYGEGVGPATLLLAPFVILIALIVAAVSVAVARLGVGQPDVDVVQFVIRRPQSEIELPPISIGASSLQFALSIATIPIAKSIAASAFYQPEIGPSWETLVGTMLVAAVTTGIALYAWRGRIDWRAPRDQQRDAEQFA